ncbi:MAG: efflux RND transporter periplasmic adaptor subunit, partial [Defluviitaleaceae bacterium]|nr:efflux RND transporter periplasmic adaptor subunit [Defluviitaleaceae bacterium]
MNSAKSIYIKQLQDVIKNPAVLSQFIIYPVMAFLMTNVVDMNMPGMSESAFVTMFAGMFVGMAIVGSVAPVIAEDRERNSLRFLLMAGVKSHEYLLGIGGVFFTFSVIGCTALAIMMPNASAIQIFVMTCSLLLGSIASILLGAIVGMGSSNEQGAIGLSSVAGLVISFGPFLANMSGNQTMQNIFRIFYTMNIVDTDVTRNEAIESFGIIFANVVVLSLIFAVVYAKQDPSNKGGVIMKKAIATILAVALVGGSVIGGIIWHNAGFIATDDAQVATTMIPVTATTAGVVERLTVQEGQEVTSGERLGWIEGGESMRAPINGLVMQTNVVQGQRVSPMETIAVISDISKVHIQANIEETDILNVQLGQEVYVRIDTFGRQRFQGYVAAIGNATLPDTSLSTSRTTQRIPIEVNLID